MTDDSAHSGILPSVARIFSMIFTCGLGYKPLYASLQYAHTYSVYRQLLSYSNYDGLITAIFKYILPFSIPYYAFYWQLPFSTNIVTPLIVPDVIFLLQTREST